MNEVVARMHVLFVTLDSLRYDVAAALFSEAATPNFQQHIPEGWQHCHSPGSFTYAAHHAFFAGFLPTPVANAKAPRLFAARFAGSETTGVHTLVFDTPDIVTGFAGHGFRTICIGGVGFFNRQTALGRVLPSLFQESYWEPAYGVTDKSSTRNQFEKAARLVTTAGEQQLFMFINVSAIHQPNYFYQPGADTDSLQSHGAAMQYVDSQLPVLLNAFRQSDRDTFCIFCSDHGTAYGEDNHYGHRVGHATVWDVPMSTFILKKSGNG
ncbi:metalloenzyme domain-containing protein [Niastella yeongjuensis]|uniref:Metalloenzyme domain-containing protein n=1 Tax=Niastella yeongjuensis TaxID=354355 RepID=A0A1V9E4V7_9BACT|nr:STM4013/SEN3800 family hydrolase [Niastella yeongjuensis]OQP41132.1 metalloenzyme domain-containing protein [Niastella yeongjuensis]